MTTDREAISEGYLEKAAKFLGRRFSVTGPIIHGDKRGRTIGFPTANLHLPNQLLPRDGIYACAAAWGGRVFKAATNVGTCPTFNGTRRRVEVYLLDYSGPDLYGEKLTVTFFEFIRPELRFEGVAELKAEIAKDIIAARKILNGV